MPEFGSQPVFPPARRGMFPQRVPSLLTASSPLRGEVVEDARNGCPARGKKALRWEHDLLGA